jgi:hypothetical protein
MKINQHFEYEQFRAHDDSLQRKCDNVRIFLSFIWSTASLKLFSKKIIQTIDKRAQCSIFSRVFLIFAFFRWHIWRSGARAQPGSTLRHFFYIIHNTRIGRALQNESRVYGVSFFSFKIFFVTFASRHHLPRNVERVERDQLPWFETLSRFRYNIITIYGGCEQLSKQILRRGCVFGVNII